MKLDRAFWRYTLLLVFTLSTVTLYMTVVSKTPLFLSAQLRTSDLLFRKVLLDEKAYHYLDKIVVIGVDNESMHRLDRAWPWGRDIFAAFLDRIRPLKPKVIGLDFLFAGKSNSEEADLWFADELAKSKNVVLASFFDRDSINPPYAYIQPSEIFMKGAKAAGLINVPFDQDGTVRRSRIVLPLAGHRGSVYALAAQLACAYKDVSPEKSIQLVGRNVIFQFPSDDPAEVLSGTSVPLDRKYHIPIAFFYPREKIRYIPFWKIIAGQIGPSEIEGKIVLVGMISDILHDTHRTPLGLMPGVFIIAQETLMILRQNFVTKVWPYHYWLVLLALTVIFSLIFYRLSHIQGLIMLLMAEWAVYDLSIWLLTAHSLILGVFSTMFVLALIFVLTVFFKGLFTLFENAALQRQVMTDGLTGLYNHNYIVQHLPMQFEVYRRLSKEFCFVMADVDWFKKVNDAYGHEKGNEVLVAVAGCLKKGVRKSDVVARYGGEEFCIILLDCNAETAREIVEKIRLSVEASVYPGPHKSFRVTISAGVCSNKTPGVLDSDSLIRLADELLYKAKTAGRNRIVVYSADEPLR